MATTKAIKKRISSVNNTKKIMKAMDLVAASKLQKAKMRLDNVRPLYNNMKTVMDDVKACMDADDEVAFAAQREVKSIAYIVLTSDRGLCGGFNVTVAKEALSQIMENEDKQEKIIAVGAKGWEYFRRRQKKVVTRFPGASEATTFADAADLGNKIASMYLSGEADEVYLIYTRFESVLSHVPHIDKLLPLNADISDDAAPSSFSMTYDPDVKTFIEYAVPMYLNITIYGALMESSVCEQAARMTSMDAATRNASEIIEDLTLEYNRKRQGMITQEITEIVTGANALK